MYARTAGVVSVPHFFLYESCLQARCNKVGEFKGRLVFAKRKLIKLW